MKKIVALSLVIFLAISSLAFSDTAGGFQIRTGIATQKLKWGSTDVSDLVDLGPAFDFGLFGNKTWLVVKDVLGVGFVIGGNITISNAVGMDMLIGPAVSATIGDIVRFNLGMGVDFGYTVMLGGKDYDIDMYEINGAGFGLDFNAVFFPKVGFSPVIGMQFANRNARNSYALFDDDMYKVTGKQKYNSFRFYIGGSVNSNKSKSK